MSVTLHQYPETLAVVRLGVGTDIPAWAESSSIFSIIATASETTIICAGRNVPAKAPHRKPYTAFRVEAPARDLAALVLPDVHVLSTFEVDWLLVPTAEVDQVAEEWRRSGATVAPAVPVQAPREQPSKPRKPTK